VVCLAWCA